MRRVDQNFVDTGKDSDETVLNGSYEEYLFFDKVRPKFDVLSCFKIFEEKTFIFILGSKSFERRRSLPKFFALFIFVQSKFNNEN